MFKKKTINHKKLFFLFLIYTLSHICFYSNNLYMDYLNPLFWLSFLILFSHHDLKLPQQKDRNMTLMISIMFCILYFASGFLFGFQKNINSLKKLWKVIIPICGIEMVRYELLKRNKKDYIFITIIMIISEIDWKLFLDSHNLILFHYLISTIIPLIAQNILFTYISLNSHYRIPIIIRLFHEVPKMILPIIPYRNWFMEGSFGLIKIFMIYYLFKNFIFHQKNIHYSTNKSSFFYPATILVSILFISFMLGLWNIQPIAILSNSMSPTFQRGDMVIYKKVEKIEPGDIIVFQYENQIIVHRVISINEYYITKGDANNTVDHIKIKKEDIKGVYQFHIKYLGYPSIWLNEFFTKENEIAK